VFIDSSSSASSHASSHLKSEKAEEEVAEDYFVDDSGYGRSAGPT
jgi:hypothetical protein